MALKKTNILLLILIMIGLMVGLIMGLGVYRFNFTDDDIYFSGETLQPENYKNFHGSWMLENSEYEDGFTLNPDSTASSINMATLLYQKWQIEGRKLILTAISLGNHTGSVFDDQYIIKSFNHKKIVLEKNNEEYVYKRVTPTIKTNLSHNTPLPTVFKYFPIEVGTKVSSKKHPIDFTSSSRAAQFKTVISQQYNTKSINYAGYYIIATWGCGSGCLEGVMIDTRDGKVHDLPTKKGYFDIGNNVENDSDSILLITSYYEHLPTSLAGSDTSLAVEMTYWLWNESVKEFVYYTTSNKIVKE